MHTLPLEGLLKLQPEAMRFLSSSLLLPAGPMYVIRLALGLFGCCDLVSVY